MASRPMLRIELRKKQNGMCCYCGVRMTKPGKKGNGGKAVPTSETLEHLHRLADGGTNHYDNMALSCHACNFGRGTMDWFSYKTVKADGVAALVATP